MQDHCLGTELCATRLCSVEAVKLRGKSLVTVAWNYLLVSGFPSKPELTFVCYGYFYLYFCYSLYYANNGCNLTTNVAVLGMLNVQCTTSGSMTSEITDMPTTAVVVTLFVYFWINWTFLRHCSHQQVGSVCCTPACLGSGSSSTKLMDSGRR